MQSASIKQMFQKMLPLEPDAAHTNTKILSIFSEDFIKERKTICPFNEI